MTFGPLIEGATLAYRLRQPTPATPQGIVFLLHGVEGSETDLSGVAQALPPDFLVVSPRGPLTLAEGRYAWYVVRFTPEPVLDFPQAEASRNLLSTFVAEIQTTYGLDAGRTAIAGFSQGGIMSAGMALIHPTQIGACGILCGRVLEQWKDRFAAPDALTRLGAFVGHGTADAVLPVTWADRTDALLTRLGVDHEVHRYPDLGHGVTPEMARDFTRWLTNRWASPDR